jgi:hypothetical protein
MFVPFYPNNPTRLVLANCVFNACPKCFLFLASTSFSILSWSVTVLVLCCVSPFPVVYDVAVNLRLMSVILLLVDLSLYMLILHSISYGCLFGTMFLSIVPLVFHLPLYPLSCLPCYSV